MIFSLLYIVVLYKGPLLKVSNTANILPKLGFNNMNNIQWTFLFY